MNFVRNREFFFEEEGVSEKKVRYIFLMPKIIISTFGNKKGIIK